MTDITEVQYMTVEDLVDLMETDRDAAVSILVQQPWDVLATVLELLLKEGV
jgi:hypothetical protein